MAPLAGSSILSLDVGEKRIGVAIASTIARIPHVHTTLTRTDDSVRDIAELAAREDVKIIVVGLPRGLNGQETDQTKRSRLFAAELEKLPVQVYLQDEALTSVQAEKELQSRNQAYSKGDIDALSAVYILQDFLIENRE